MDDDTKYSWNYGMYSGNVSWEHQTLARYLICLGRQISRVKRNLVMYHCRERIR